MEILTEVVEKLRNEHNFGGYIHLKAIPGADEELINKAGRLVDRMSVNLELPSDKSLKLLAPEKNKEEMFKFSNNIISILLVISIVIFVVAVITTWVIGYSALALLVKPIKRVQEEAVLLAEGDFSGFIESNSRSEIGELIASVNSINEKQSIFISDLKDIVRDTNIKNNECKNQMDTILVI